MSLATAGIAAFSLGSASAQTPQATSEQDQVDFSYGDISATVPANPERVVVLEGRGDLEFAVITGLPIIASGNTWWPEEVPGSRLDGKASSDIPMLTIDNRFEVNLEELVQLEPDLLVMRANAYRSDSYGNAALEQFAPILPVEVNEADWHSDLVAQADILGRSEQIQPFLDDYDARLTQAQEEVGELIQDKVVYLITASQEWAYIRGQEFSCQVAADLGMNVPPFANNEETIEISTEQFNLMEDADLIIRQLGADKSVDEIDDVATWKLLPAVKKGHVYNLDAQFNNGSAIQAKLLLDELVQAAKLLESN